MLGKERARCRKGEEDEQHVREGRERREVGSGREAMGGGAIGGCGGGGGGRGGAATGRRAGGSYERERVWGRGDGEQNSNFWQHFQVRFYFMMFPVPFIQAVLVGAECGRRRANS